MTVTSETVETLLAEYQTLKRVPRNIKTIAALERLLELLDDMDENDAERLNSAAAEGGRLE